MPYVWNWIQLKKIKLYDESEKHFRTYVITLKCVTYIREKQLQAQCYIILRVIH